MDDKVNWKNTIVELKMFNFFMFKTRFKIYSKQERSRLE